MQISMLSREAFLEWLAGSYVPKTLAFKDRQFSKPLDAEVALLWKGEPSKSAVPVILVKQQGLREFYAFVSTYVSTYCPFSAFFHVVPYESAATMACLQESSSPAVNIPDELIGVAIAEAYAQSRGKIRSLNELSVQGIQATLSATLLEFLIRGGDLKDMNGIAEKWAAIRNSSSDTSLVLSSEMILDVWTTIGRALTSAKASKARDARAEISSALKGALVENSSLEKWFFPLTNSIPELGEAVRNMTLAREERVRTLPMALNSLRQSNTDPLLKEFVVGGLLSMVGNGSFDQLKLLDEILRDFPKAALWFGVISSLQKRSDVLTAGNCLGRRVARDVKKSVEIFAPPESDISFEELMILGEETLKADSFRTAHSGVISVALYGTVASSFRNPKSKRQEIDAQVSREQAKINLKEFEELRFLLDRANRVLRNLQPSSQRDLFDDSSKYTKRR
ncbi:hypothetical protein [Yoonia sp.]|uniref:hypothetical protein n=1 Tax=Yoonia sp. TaxID=2212373 RepID=UPI0025F33202|nr:hypothetical protein [Yoonia sp.]